MVFYMRLTWFGCASFRIECGDVTLWTDPFITMASNAENITDEGMFAATHEILISHGHFDHLMSIPECSAHHEVCVHCTDTPCKTLLRFGLPERQLHCCAPGDSFNVGNVGVRVYQGEHNIPDAQMVLGVIFRILTSLKNVMNFLKIFHIHGQFPEAGETVIFEITHGGKRIVFIGSPGLPEGADYPASGADVLILPYQGTSNPAPTALRIVDMLKPKSIILSHFDNAIPPLTGKIKLRPFLDTMYKQYPEISVCVPQFSEAITIPDLAAAAEA